MILLDRRSPAPESRRPCRRRLARVLALPGVEQLLDVAPLRVAELEAGEQPPRLGDVVVLDRRLEVLAGGNRLAQLPPQPAEKADLGRFHGPSLAWAVTGSNRRPPGCKPGALPAELTARAPEP